MEKASVSEEEIRVMENYLKGYAFHEKMTEMDEISRRFFEGGIVGLGEMDISLGRVRQFEIRHFLMGMENSMEKLFLYYHYVKGDSVERCAILLGVSRSTAFRLRHRALALAVIHKRNKIARDAGEGN